MMSFLFCLTTCFVLYLINNKVLDLQGRVTHLENVIRYYEVNKDEVDD